MKNTVGMSRSVRVGVGIHLRSARSPFLFVTLMDKILKGKISKTPQILCLRRHLVAKIVEGKGLRYITIIIRAQTRRNGKGR